MSSEKRLYKCEVLVQVDGPLSWQYAKVQVSIMASSPEEAQAHVKNSLTLSVKSVGLGKAADSF